MPAAELDRIVAFLGEIGLPPREAPVAGASFLPGIRLVRGELVFDRERLRWPGDLLHEAGHLALTPARYRHTLDGDVAPTQHFAHGGEVEAIAWSFAAAMQLSLPIDTLFHAEGYGGQSQALMLTYSLGVYPGVAGLIHLGLAAVGEDALRRGIPAYPHMIGWVRD